MIDDIQREMLVHMISEATYGDDPVVGTPSAFMAMISCDITPVREFRQDASVRGVHSPGKHISLASHCDVSMEFYLTGRSGAAGTAPAWAPLLKAANFKEVINAGVSVSYKPVTITDDMGVVPSCTIYKYHKLGNGQAMLQKAHGVRGNLTITVEHGQRIRVKFEGKGLYNELAAPAAAPSNPTAYAGDSAGLLAQGIVATLDAEPLPLESFELATNWTVEPLSTWSGPANVDCFKLKRGDDSAIGGSFNYKSRALLEYVIAQYQLDSVLPLAIEATNGVATVEINAPALQLGQYAKTAGNIYSFAQPYWLRGDFGNTSGEDDVEFLFS
jgi:hypothetical protein